MTFTAEDKFACVRRELGYRRHVYARRVTDGAMKKDQADREIALMEAIAADYEEQAKKERLL